MQITKMYYLGQSTAEQISIVKENITRLEELRDITTAFFDNGMAMEVDVKRVNINLENLQVQYDNAVAMLTQQINMLKYVIDYPAETDITLTPVDTESIIPVEMSGLYEGQPELELLKKQSTLAEKQKKMISQGYDIFLHCRLPEVSCTRHSPTRRRTGSTTDRQANGITHQA